MSLNVIDTIPPTITCPDDIFVSNDPDSCSAWVTVGIPDVFDNCGIDTVYNNYNWTGNATDEYPDGIYHYHITDEDPYINGNGFFGEPGTVSN